MRRACIVRGARRCRTSAGALDASELPTRADPRQTQAVSSSTPHSPLPPPPLPSIELLTARLDHIVTVIEVMADRVESIDDRWENRMDRLMAREQAMSHLARRLGSAALSMSAARLMPTFRWLFATSLGAFAGGIVGAVVWQWVHAASALAHP